MQHGKMSVKTSRNYLVMTAEAIFEQLLGTVLRFVFFGISGFWPRGNFGPGAYVRSFDRMRTGDSSK